MRTAANHIRRRDRHGGRGSPTLTETTIEAPARRKVVMASAQPKPDFPAKWAVEGSNLRPWD